MSDNTPIQHTVAEPDARGRRVFLQAAAALAAGDHDSFSEVVTELTIRHPSAWQSALLAGAREHAVAASLEQQAVEAQQHADAVGGWSVVLP